jgi:signal peptidase I
MVRLMLAELPTWAKSLAARLLEALVALLVVEVVATALIPAILGLHLVIVTDTSMAPAIAFGSLAYEQPGAPAQVDSVITFTDPTGTVVTHRVVATQLAASGSGTAYVTRGDANAANDDGIVGQDQVSGIVVASISQLGTIQRILDLTAVKVFLGAILVLLVLVAVPGRRKAPESAEPGPK